MAAACSETHERAKSRYAAARRRPCTGLWQRAAKGRVRDLAVMVAVVGDFAIEAVVDHAQCNAHAAVGELRSPNCQCCAAHRQEVLRRREG